MIFNRHDAWDVLNGLLREMHRSDKANALENRPVGPIEPGEPSWRFTNKDKTLTYIVFASGDAKLPDPPSFWRIY